MALRSGLTQRRVRDGAGGGAAESKSASGWRRPQWGSWSNLLEEGHPRAQGCVHAVLECLHSGRLLGDTQWYSAAASAGELGRVCGESELRKEVVPGIALRV